MGTAHSASVAYPHPSRRYLTFFNVATLLDGVTSYHVGNFRRFSGKSPKITEKLNVFTANQINNIFRIAFFSPSFHQKIKTQIFFNKFLFITFQFSKILKFSLLPCYLVTRAFIQGAIILNKTTPHPWAPCTTAHSHY